MTAQGSPVAAPGTDGDRRRTLAKALSTSDNALNAVRLVLALLVIFGHIFPLGGFSTVTWGPFAYRGWHATAVEGFFAISGYLILASAVRIPLASFLWRRFLRIYPGYVVALVVTAFVAAPLGMVFGARWDASGALRYVLRSLTLKAGDLPVGAPIPWSQSWNGSLWTLFYEGLAYILVGVVMAIPAARRSRRAVVCVGALIVTVAYIGVVHLGLHLLLPPPFAVLVGSAARLWVFFAWGMVAFVFAEQIRWGWGATAAAGVFALGVLTIPGLDVLYPGLLIALPVLLLGLGMLLPTRVGSVNDLSYGVYVYAFPVQQLLVLAGIAHAGWFVAAAVCALCTIPLAWLSWHCVERKALALKGILPVVPR